MFFKQIKSKGDNFSYVIADENNGEAVIVDPSFNADTIINLIEECGCTVKYVINTHSHWDHVAGNDKIIDKFNTNLVAHQLSKVNKTISVVDGDILKIGNVTIRIIHTPGHTQDSICLLIDDLLLTGDTLFVGGCGRTDLPGGSSSEMYNSLFNKLMKLNDEIKVYPGHDYGPVLHSTIGREKKTNYTLKKRTLKQFIEFVKEP